MGCDQTMNVLPIIDFSDFKQETQTWESVKMEVKKALEEYGCFEATFDEINMHFQKSLIDAIQELFDLPLETKLRNNYEKPYRGYIGYSLLPLYESLGIKHVLSPGEIDAFINLLWPHGNLTLSKMVESAKQMHEVDTTVRRMVVESFGLEKYMDEQMNSTERIFRFQKYDAPGINETKLGLESHTDGGVITILYQNEVNGLQVQTKNGEWITAGSSSNGFIVMAGHSLHISRNISVHQLHFGMDKWESVPPNHRVLMSGDEDRYSIVFFSTPKPGYIIKAPQEMVNEDHPLLYKPFEHQKFTDFAYSEAGSYSKDVLKDFCGI